MAPGGNRGWLLRLVIAFSFAQGAVSMARPAVSYRALSLGADERAIGVIAGVYALLPLFAAVPLGRRTDHGRCAPLLPVGVVLISGGCALSGLANSLWTMAMWSGVMGLGHLCFVIGAQSLVARQSAPHEQDRNFGHFTIGASLGQLIGPIAAGALIGGSDMAGSSALALLVAGAGAAAWRCSTRGTPRSNRTTASKGGCSIAGVISGVTRTRPRPISERRRFVTSVSAAAVGRPSSARWTTRMSGRRTRQRTRSIMAISLKVRSPPVRSMGVFSPIRATSASRPRSVRTRRMTSWIADCAPA